MLGMPRGHVQSGNISSCVCCMKQKLPPPGLHGNRAWKHTRQVESAFPTCVDLWPQVRQAATCFKILQLVHFITSMQLASSSFRLLHRVQ